jgi:hypothetical protein
MRRSEIAIDGVDEKTAVTCKVLADDIREICTELWAERADGWGMGGKVGCLSRPIQSKISANPASQCEKYVQLPMVFERACLAIGRET